SSDLDVRWLTICIHELNLVLDSVNGFGRSPGRPSAHEEWIGVPAMPRRPTVNVKKITRKAVKSYGYVRPNPGVRAIAAINGRGSYRSARSEMSGLTPAKRRARAKSAVRNATGSSSMPRRKIHRNASYRRPRVYAKRPSVSFTVPKARGRGKRRIAFRAPKGFQKGETVTIMAKNRRRRRPRTASGRFRKLAANRRRKTTTAKRRPVRRRKARRVVRNARRVVRKRKSPVRRRRVVRNRRRKSPVRRRRVVRNRRRKSPVRSRTGRRQVVRTRRRPVRRRKITRRAASRRAHIRRSRRRRRSGISRSFRRNPSGVIMQWVKTGGFIAAGVISHKFFAGF